MTCGFVIDGAMGQQSAIAIAITIANVIIMVQSWSRELRITGLIDGTGQEGEHDHQEHTDWSHHTQWMARQQFAWQM